MTIRIANYDAIHPLSDEILAAVNDFLLEIGQEVTCDHKPTNWKHYYHFHVTGIPDTAIPLIRELQEQIESYRDYAPQKRYLTVSETPEMFYTKYGAKKANPFAVVYVVDVKSPDKSPEIA